MLVVALFAGFTRPHTALNSLAISLRDAGFATEQPEICRRWWPLDYLSEHRQRMVAMRLRTGHPRAVFILVGHSAGAAAACGVARFLGSAVRGIVSVDGVDSPTRSIRSTLSNLSAPFVALCGASSSCNRHGALCRELSGRPGVQVLDCSWMPHGAVEPPGTVLYERVCGGQVTLAQHERAINEVVAAVKGLASGEIER